MDDTHVWYMYMCTNTLKHWHSGDIPSVRNEETKNSWALKSSTVIPNTISDSDILPYDFEDSVFFKLLI